MSRRGNERSNDDLDDALDEEVNTDFNLDERRSSYDRTTFPGGVRGGSSMADPPACCLLAIDSVQTLK